MSTYLAASFFVETEKNSEYQFIGIFDDQKALTEELLRMDQSFSNFKTMYNNQNVDFCEVFEVNNEKFMLLPWFNKTNVSDADCKFEFILLDLDKKEDRYLSYYFLEKNSFNILMAQRCLMNSENFHKYYPNLNFQDLLNI